MVSIDMKVIDKGLQGKGHSVAFVKLAGEDGSSMKIILDSRNDLYKFEIGEIYTVKVVCEQQKLEVN